MKTPKTEPNHTVYEWLQPYYQAGATVSSKHYPNNAPVKLPAPVESIIIGVSYLGASGYKGQPKLTPNKLLEIISTQETISTARVKELLPSASESTIDNYTRGARVASKAIFSYLTKQPDS